MHLNRFTNPERRVRSTFLPFLVVPFLFKKLRLVIPNFSKTAHLFRTCDPGSQLLVLKC